MREIRQFQSVTDETRQADHAKPIWSAGRRAMFVLGLPIFLISAGIAGYSFWKTAQYKPIYVTKPTVADVRAHVSEEVMRLDIDKLTPLESVEKIWKPLTANKELPPYREHPYLGFRRARDGYHRRLTWASVVAGVGLLLTVLPMVLPNGNKRDLR